MKRFLKFCLLVLLSCQFFVLTGYSQWHKKVICLAPTQQAVFLDSNSIYTPSLQFSSSPYFTDTIRFRKEDYSLDSATNIFQWIATPTDTIYLRFQVFPFALQQSFQRYTLRTNTPGINLEKEREKFQIETNSTTDLFGGSALHKSGSLARGIGFGNNQSLGLNSALNLQLNGQIASNLTLTAALSDANIPFQASGTTNQLREFDQVFIQIHNEQLKITAGDFWIDKPDGQLMRYRKRGQGITGQYNWQTDRGAKLYTQSSVGLSKGKFQRQIIQGLEAVQGPYRLTGATNEPFILILAGTERIYIDGRLIMENRKVLTVDENEIMDRCAILGHDLLKRTGLKVPGRWPIL